MSTLVNAWEAIAPTPVEKGDLVEPEATDRFAPRPWLRLPPGALALFGGSTALALAAAVQVGFTEVRRDGLPVDLPIPALQSQSPPAQQAARKRRAAHKNKLHRALRDQRSTQWSRAG